MAHLLDMSQIPLIGLDDAQQEDFNAPRRVTAGTFPFGSSDEIVGL